MSVNSSSNSTLRPPCRDIGAGVFVFTALFVVYILLLLPIFILVLYTGCQRSRKRRSVAAAAGMSHSDIFTFIMVALELISFLGSSLYCYGAYTNRPQIIKVGFNIFSIISPGQTLLHLLTCVERYLAVVHPVTYLGLRRSGGVRIRNISVACVWVICAAAVGLAEMVEFVIVSHFLFLIFCLIVVSFCCASVLHVLIRPGPGEMGGNRVRVDQSKHRAFHTMMAVIGALLSRFLSTLVNNMIYSFNPRDCDVELIVWSTSWFSLPSSLVLPLLLLHRAGKLPACKHNTESD